MGIKVIAIGNILMGDDGIGIRVLENIESDLKSYGIESFIGETDFEYCISLIQDGDFIIIIDAAMFGKKIGSVAIISLEEYRYYKKKHDQHSNSLLDLVYTYYKDVKGYIIGIEIENIDYVLNISKSLELLLEKISLSVLYKILELAPIAEKPRLS